MCPCDDPLCHDVHRHDVTAVLDMKIDLTRLLAGVLEGGTADGTQSPVV